jgi:hypothetical protein
MGDISGLKRSRPGSVWNGRLLNKAMVWEKSNMSETAGETIRELEFIYESDAASSFLVVMCAGRIIEYQAGMLDNNDIEYIIPLEIVKKEDANYFYCNITSQVPLSIYLKRNKLSREAFLRLILNISACISNSAGYLLYPSNFLMKPEFIYIDPVTLDVMIVYIPAEFRHDGTGSLQALVSELLMLHINEKGFCSGNLVQRILSEIKSETFSIRGLMALINELLYRMDDREAPALQPDRKICTKTLEENRGIYKIEEKKEASESIRKKKSLYAVIIAILLQLVMGSAIYLCRGVIAGTGKGAAVNYIAVVLIVLAVEVLVIRKLQAMKLFSIRDISDGVADMGDSGTDKCDNGTNKRNAEADMIDLRSDKSDTGANKCDPVSVPVQSIRPTQGTIGMAMTSGTHTPVQCSGDNETKRPPTNENAPCLSHKTESLGVRDEARFVLISSNRHLGEKDIIIDRDEFIVGRLAGHVDHILYNNAVGKLHAVFIRRDGCCYVKDLNSMNGTFINGKRIESNREELLSNNDNLRLANCEFIFSCGSSNKLNESNNGKEAGRCLTEDLYGLRSQC